LPHAAGGLTCIVAKSPEKIGAHFALIAVPVSCAMTRRLSGRDDKGEVVDRNTGAPSGVVMASTAMLRPGVNGTPSAPIGPSVESGSSRKNT